MSEQLMHSDFDFNCVFDDAYLSGDDTLLLADFEVVEPEVEKRRKRKTRTRAQPGQGWEVGTKVQRIANRAHFGTIRRRHASYMENRVVDIKINVVPLPDPFESLMFIPTTFAAYCNSANTAEMSKLFLSHLTKNCAMKVHSLADEAISTGTFFTYYDLRSQLLPDFTMRVQSTKVESNQIRASVLVTYTACKMFYDTLAGTPKDAMFAPVFTHRDASLKRHINRADLPEDTKHQFYSLLDTDADLQIRSLGDMTLTVDQATGKVSCFSMRCRITAIEPVQLSSSTNGEGDSINGCI